MFLYGGAAPMRNGGRISFRSVKTCDLGQLHLEIIGDVHIVFSEKFAVVLLLTSKVEELEMQMYPCISLNFTFYST